MTTPLSADLLQLLQATDDAMNIARYRGYELPDEWVEAKAVAAAAERIINTPTPVITALPESGTVADYCAALAAERAAHDGQVAAARELLDRAKREAGRLAMPAAADFAERISAEANTKLIPQLRELLGAAPRQITGHEAPKELAAHADLLRTIEALAVAAHHRGRLAALLGEGTDLGRDGAVFLYINPGRNASITAIRDTIRQFADTGIPATIDGWVALLHTDSEFAGIGQAAERYDRWRNAASAGMHTPDGGMLDHTLGEYEDLTASRAAVV